MMVISLDYFINDTHYSENYEYVKGKDLVEK